MQNERHDKILKQLAVSQRVMVKALAREYAVTEDCIRKDLAILSKEGKLKRVHGGAVPVRESFHIRQMTERSSTAKKAIAKEAASLVKPGMMVFLDISSICLDLAKELLEQPGDVVIVTNMSGILDLYAQDRTHDFIFIGGQFDKQRDGFIGSLAREQIRHLQFDLAFVGAVGIDAAKGQVMTYNVEDGLTKRTILDHARQKVLLAEADKFRQDGHYAFADLSDFDALITDCDSLPDLSAQTDVHLIIEEEQPA